MSHEPLKCDSLSCAAAPCCGAQMLFVSCGIVLVEKALVQNSFTSHCFSNFMTANVFDNLKIVAKMFGNVTLAFVL